MVFDTRGTNLIYVAASMYCFLFLIVPLLLLFANIQMNDEEKENLKLDEI